MAISPSTPPSDGRCLLLALPRELRDEIYQYALTIDEELSCNMGYQRASPVFRFTINRGDTPPTDFNMLKFVCWQLYTETAALGLNWNTLAFYRDLSLHKLAVTLFKYFLRSCGEKQKARIRKVVVYEDRSACQWLARHHGNQIKRHWHNLLFNTDTTIYSTSALHNFCRTYPRATVIVRYDNGITASEVVCLCHWIWFLRILFGHERDIQLQTRETLHVESWSSRFRGALDGRDRLANLRFFPTAEFNEGIFREGFVQSDLDGYTDEQVEERVILMKRLFDDGV